jgi:heptaprenyl diphosphate synthase
MIVAKHLLPFGTVGVSVLGAIAHNAGQIIAAVIVMETTALTYYLIPLVISGTIAGVFVGIIAAIITARLEKVIK